MLRDKGTSNLFAAGNRGMRPLGAAKPPKTLAQYFDDMRSDYDTVGNAITEHSNAHPNDSETTLGYLAWWTSVGEQMNQLIRDVVLTNPAVIASIAIIRQNSNQLTTVSKEMKRATVTLNQINSGLALLSALVSLFKR